MLQQTQHVRTFWSTSFQFRSDKKSNARRQIKGKRLNGEIELNDPALRSYILRKRGANVHVARTMIQGQPSLRSFVEASGGMTSGATAVVRVLPGVPARYRA
jgi:hypothetical protein